MTQVKVLVIDDEALIRWSIEQTLQAAGYDVAVAATAAEGMTLLRQLEPDVVLIDVQLPDADGLSVLGRIRQERGPETAVIVMTAFAEVCTAVEAARAGANDYLKKPFDVDELPGVVARALANTDCAAAAAHDAVTPVMRRAPDAYRPTPLSPDLTPLPDGGVWSPYSIPPSGICLEAVEKDLVRQALEIAKGNQTHAAQLLAISRDQLRYRMLKFGFRQGGRKPM